MRKELLLKELIKMKKEAINYELARSLINPIDKKYYFNPDETIYYYIPDENQYIDPKWSKKGIITGLPSYVIHTIKSILEKFSKDTGFHFQEISKGEDFFDEKGCDKNRLMIGLGFITKSDAITWVQSVDDFCLDEDGAKIIIGFREEFIQRHYHHPRYFELVFLHELFHGFHLDHPIVNNHQDYEYLKTLGKFDYRDSECIIKPDFQTIMVSHHDFIENCYDKYPNNPDVCNYLIPSPPYFPVDLALARGEFPNGNLVFQNCTVLDQCLLKGDKFKYCFNQYPLYESSEGKITGSKKDFMIRRTANTELLDPSWKPFVSSFLKTLFDESLITVLQKNTFLEGFHEKHVKFISAQIIDLCLYSFSLEAFILSSLSHLVLFFLEHMGLNSIKVKNDILKPFIFSVQAVIWTYWVYQGDHKSLSTNFFAISSAFAGSMAAKAVIVLVDFFRNRFQSSELLISSPLQKQ